MSKIDLQNLAKLLHLKMLPTEVYISLLIHGELTRDQLKTLMDKKDDEIQESIDRLLERNMILRVGNSEEEMYEVTSFDLLEEEVEKQREALADLKKFVIYQSLRPEKLGVLTFEGLEGIRNVYLEVLEEALKTKQNIYAIENNRANVRIGNQFFDEYIQRRTEKGIKAYILSPYTIEDKEYQNRFQSSFTKIKLLKNFPINANINIVGNLVMSFSLNPPQGALRRNKAEAQTWKEVFQKLWRKKS